MELAIDCRPNGDAERFGRTIVLQTRQHGREWTIALDVFTAEELGRVGVGPMQVFEAWHQALLPRLIFE